MSEPSTPDLSATGAVSAGAMLRSAREAAGLHIAALAVTLKVPVAKIEALEGDRYEALPDAVFARALAASICKALKIDPAPVLERLPGARQTVLVPDSQRSHGVFRAQGEGLSLPLPERLSRPLVLVIGMLVLGIAVLLLWPQGADPGSPDPATRASPDPSGTSVVTVPVPVQPAAPAGSATTEPAATSAALPASSAVPGVPVAAASSQGPAAALAPASPAQAASAPSGAASQAAAPGAAGLVEFRARGSTWVSVTDASGASRLRRTLSSGESAVAHGTPPLTVIVGKADVTEVRVRGAAFDLGPFSRENVARFQVK